MTFSVHNLRLNQDVAAAVRSAGKDLFTVPLPERLHHYTGSPVVRSIINSRSLWATSIARQKDMSEITHASDMVGSLAESMARGASSAFVRDVLAALPRFMEERRNWIFIACFCDDADSAKHWKHYGSVCLTFPHPRHPEALALSDTNADCWYQPVIYDERRQRKGLECALEGVVQALTRNVRGTNEGPWASAMVEGCARPAAQMLLGLAAGFKRQSFAWEREWRVVCSPQLGHINSAPDLIDDDFLSNVKEGVRTHIKLEVPQSFGAFVPLTRPKVPFTAWDYNPRLLAREEAGLINAALREHNRPDLVRSERPVRRSFFGLHL